METIALFGGSFDPPHIAHETIVKKALEIKDVDKVVIMPTYLNPFKEQFYAPATTRIDWLRKIFSPLKNVIISSFEVDLKRKVPSIESVQYLLQNYKKIYLIIGADNIASLPKWHRYDELKELVTFIVVTREGITIPSSFLTINLEENISSTDLRKHPDAQYLSQACADEIVSFYKEKNDR